MAQRRTPTSTRLVYKPEGVEPKSWPFDPEKMPSNELILIEQLTGMTFGEWADAITRGSMTALHAALWVLLRRADDTLEPSALVFTMDDVDVIEEATKGKAPGPKATKRDGSSTSSRS